MLIDGVVIHLYWNNGLPWEYECRENMAFESTYHVILRKDKWLKYTADFLVSDCTFEIKCFD